MAKTFEYNPNRGVWYEYEDDAQSGGLFIHTKQDCQPVIDHAKKLRDSGVNDKVGLFNHYAIIPAGVELELRDKGLSIYDRNNTKRLLQEINTNYPHLKVSNLTHNVKSNV
jgi:hypothetical protein